MTIAYPTTESSAMLYLANPHSRSARQAQVLRRIGHSQIGALVTGIVGFSVYFCTPFIGLHPFRGGSFLDVLKAVGLALVIGYGVGLPLYAYLNQRWRRLVRTGQVGRLHPDLLQYWHTAISQTPLVGQPEADLGPHSELLFALHGYTNDLERLHSGSFSATQKNQGASQITANARHAIDDALAGLVATFNYQRAQLENEEQPNLWQE